MSETKSTTKSFHQLTENVKLLQKVVLIHNSRILILQRNENSKTRPLCWDLPGGNSEWPETESNHSDQGSQNQKDLNKENMHQEDIAREIKEETDLTVFSQHFTHENMVSFRTFYEAQKDVYSIITSWRVEMPSDFDRSQVKLSNEHIDSKWIDISELKDYDFGGKSGEFIKDMIREAL
jgi:8-oxo-dGTP pyrophosphatase MutT (NUDIX family)